MGRGNSNILTDNYLENWEFTKIEIILLAGVLTIFLPFIFFPVVDNYDIEIESIIIEKANKAEVNLGQLNWGQERKTEIISKFSLNEQQFDEVHEQITKKFNDDLDIELENIETIKQEGIIPAPKVNVENIIDNIKEREQELLDNGVPEDEAHAALEDEFGKEVIEAKENVDGIRKQILNIHESVYKHQKSYEYQNRIYLAFGIAVFLLLLTTYLSRKGYTSYTPWLEKLANDKLSFDLKLFQHIDDSATKKLEQFYVKTFEFTNKWDNTTPRHKNSVAKSELFGWNPIDENKKWYAVFSEKLDYRFYEIAFKMLWPEWFADNYLEDKDDQGDYKIKTETRQIVIYGNPEIVPDLSNDDIKKELEKTKTQTNADLELFESEKVELESKIKNEKNIVDWSKIVTEINNAERSLVFLKEQSDGMNDNLRISREEEVKSMEKMKALKERLEEEKSQEIKNLEKELEEKKAELKENEEKIGTLGLELERMQEEFEKAKPEDRNSMEEKLDEKTRDVEDKLTICDTEKKEIIEKINEYEKKLEKTKSKDIKKWEKELVELEELHEGERKRQAKQFDLLMQSGIEESLEEARKNLRDKKNKSKDVKFKEIRNYEKKIKEVTSRVIKLKARLALDEIKELGDDGTCLDVILNQMDIFEEDENGEIKNKDKIEKLLIRKIQNDILYYAVMINFRRGLQKATRAWLKADDSLKTTEAIRIEENADKKDVGGSDLADAVQSLISKMENELVQKRKSWDSNDLSNFTKSDGEENNQSNGNTDSDDDNINKKINRIHQKLVNRNNWETAEWRAMGSIYYKWREDGREKVEIDQIEIAKRTTSERIGDWIDKQKGIEKKSEVDPTEKRWKEHRTIRAVNSLSDSFGFQKKNTGKAILFFGVVFALIISTALLNSLDIVIEAMQLPDPCDFDNCWHTDWEFLWSNYENYQYVILLFLCFFPLGILFYHQGSIFLSERAAAELTLGNKPLIFVNFLFLLLQAIVVYFLASSIGDVNAFLSLLMLLVTIDLVWVVVFTWNDMRDSVRDSPVYLEWIVLDIIIGMFAYSFSLNYALVPEIFGDGWEGNMLIFVMLLAVLLTRAGVDYSYAWKNFWSLFADAE